MLILILIRDYFQSDHHKSYYIIKPFSGFKYVWYKSYIKPLINSKGHLEGKGITIGIDKG